MPRFFVDAAAVNGGTALITGQDANHMQVLRMKPGESLVLCDGAGTDHRCRIRRIENGLVEAEVLESNPSLAEPSVDCTVFAGFAKGDRVDYLVQKCTEAGARSIVFFLSERCVARPDAKAIPKKLSRLNRIAEEAAKQSGRGLLPEVRFLMDFDSAVRQAGEAELSLFMYETGERQTIRQAIERAGVFRSCSIITGPEGGFEPAEAEKAARAGMTPVSMGPRILRCETAPLIALTAVLYATDNL